MTMRTVSRKAAFVVLLGCPLAIAWAGHDDTEPGSSNAWLSAGHDLHNTRNAATEHILGPGNVASLVPRWTFTTHGNVSATPSSDGDAVYVPDWGGYLFRIHARTGAQVWARQISEYDGIAGSISRTTPAITDDKIIIGTQRGAHVIAVDKRSGRLVWSTQVDDHAAAIVTQSPVVHGGRVYVGVASGEEGLAANPAYPCCSFRGSVLALDLRTGAILWKSYVVPEGYAGAAVWGSTPVVDLKRRSLYVTTGNNYAVPASVTACVAAAGDEPVAAEACLADDDYMDSIVALDLDTGRIRWGHRLQAYDVWTVACIVRGCEPQLSPDYDFGSGPNLFTVGKGKHRRDLVGAGQKSGVYWALDPDDGRIVWGTVVGPGSTLGGVQWGAAVDGDRVYVAVSNFARKPYTLAPSGATITWGAYSALDGATGRILWQTADPAGSFPLGPVSVANGVVFAESIAAQGPLYAFNAATGQLLWSFQSVGSALSGAAVVNGTVYWGSGYEPNRFGVPDFTAGNNTLYAFERARR